MILHLINLDRNPERLQRMNALASARSIKFTRLQAIDGSKFSADFLKRYVNPKPKFYQLGSGEIACSLSHVEAWERIAAGGDPYGAVFEDDLFLSEDIGQYLNSFDWIPADADIVKLETTKARTTVSKIGHEAPGNRKLHILHGRHTGAAGYILKKEVAQALIAEGEKCLDPLDQLLFNPGSDVFGTIMIYQVHPAVCVQQANEEKGNEVHIANSTLHLERERNKPVGLAKIWREISRPFLQLSDAWNSGAIGKSATRIRLRIPYRP